MMADDGEQLGLATEVTVAWLSNPHTRAQAEEVTAMLGSVLTALRGFGAPTPAALAESAPLPEYTPAVTARRSLASSDRILSMIDGKPYGSLKRHLRNHGLTPDEYRQRYGLKPDYPMVAPGYSSIRRAIAKQQSFGRKPVSEPSAAAAPEPTAKAAPEPQSQAVPQPASEPAASAKRRRLGIRGAKQAAQAHLGAGEGADEEGEAQSTPTEA